MKLKQVFQEWGKWHQGTPTLLEELGGLSNQSFLIESTSERFVVRLNRASENLGVCRDREQEILYAIDGLHFAPDVCFWGSDYLVTKFVISNSKTSPDLETVADLFRQIHQVNYINQDALNPLDQLSAYYHQIDSPDEKLNTCYEALFDLGRESDSVGFCLCHHDLLPENIIQSKDTVTVIDWEYAQYGDPLFDLAIYAESMNLDKTQTNKFIAAYDKEIDIASLKNFRLIYALINLLWWKIRKPRKDISPGLLKLENRIRKA